MEPQLRGERRGHEDPAGPADLPEKLLSLSAWEGELVEGCEQSQRVIGGTYFVF